MKILLLGEFSGVNTSLNSHLLSLGHDVSFFAERDGWKDYKGESFFYRYGRSKWLYFLNVIYVLFNLRKLTNYDYVFFISPNFPGKLYYLLGIYHLLVKRNKKIVYYACGTDYGYVSTRKFSEYSPYVEGGAVAPKFNRIDKLLFNWFAENVSTIYSSAPDYAFFFRNRSNYLGHKCLPLVFDNNFHRNKALNSKKVDRIKIFHPISRPEFKGSKFIIQALEKFRKMPGIEVVIVERVSLSELENHLSDTDILIDQCLGYGFGILATLGMHYECIVLTGFRDENSCVFHPGIYNIDPDVERIEGLLESLIKLSKIQLKSLQLNSQRYISELNKNNIKDIFL